MSVLNALDAEWRLLAGSPRARRSLMRWSGSHPALAGLADFDAVLARRRDPVAAGEVLAALAGLAPHDELAVRVLLQAVIPGLVRLAATCSADDPQAMDEVLSLAWERIRTYPTTRHGSVEVSPA